MAPFIATMRCEKMKPLHWRDVLPERQVMPVVPQLLSNNAVDFLALAERLYDLGYGVINWNLGCPYPMVAKKKRGSGLLPYPELIEALLEQVAPQMRARLSIKLRLGYRNAAEIEALMPILNRFPLESVILHPRLGVQMYEGEADVDAFIKAAAQIRHFTVYNGDINNPETFTKVRSQLPHINAFMLGRYVLVNPFLPEQLRGQNHTETEMQTRFAAFYEDLTASYQAIIPTPAHLMMRLKAYWNYFAAGFADGQKAVKKILRAQTYDNFQTQARLLLQNQPPRESSPVMIVKS